MRKMIHVSMASHEALQALAAETRQSFQDLIDEAIADLLKKHKIPYEIKVYPDQKHVFTGDASKDALKRTIAFLARHLKNGEKKAAPPK